MFALPFRLSEFFLFASFFLVKILILIIFVVLIVNEVVVILAVVVIVHIILYLAFEVGDSRLFDLEFGVEEELNTGLLLFFILTLVNFHFHEGENIFSQIPIGGICLSSAFVYPGETETPVSIFKIVSWPNL